MTSDLISDQIKCSVTRAQTRAKSADRISSCHPFSLLREILELANLDIVIQNRTQTGIEHLQAVCEEYTRYSPDFFDRQKSALNTDFHLSLARMGKNPFLIRYLEHLYEWIDLRVMFNLLPSDRVRRSAVEHTRILEALKAGQKATLKRALQQHLRGPTKIMLQRLQQMERR